MTAGSPVIAGSRLSLPTLPSDAGLNSVGDMPLQTDSPSLSTRLAAEGVGSFFLFATVIGFGIMAEL